jgi:hypothetical protein
MYTHYASQYSIMYTHYVRQYIIMYTHYAMYTHRSSQFIRMFTVTKFVCTYTNCKSINHYVYTLCNVYTLCRSLYCMYTYYAGHSIVCIHTMQVTSFVCKPQVTVSVFGHPTPICPWTPTTTLKKK